MGVMTSQVGVPASNRPDYSLFCSLQAKYGIYTITITRVMQKVLSLIGFFSFIPGIS